MTTDEPDPISDRHAWEIAVLAGIDEVIGAIQRIATGPEFEGKPTATLAAGWISGLALRERERLQRSVEEFRGE